MGNGEWETGIGKREMGNKEGVHLEHARVPFPVPHFTFPGSQCPSPLKSFRNSSQFPTPISHSLFPIPRFSLAKKNHNSNVNSRNVGSIGLEEVGDG